MKAALMLSSLVSLLMSPAAVAQSGAAPPPVISNGWRFEEQDGAALYRAICQGCHMEQGQGAQGAAAYPALAANARLASALYVPYILINGRKAMPPVGRMLSDEQVAAVTNYVRTNLRNDYRDTVGAAEVKALRPARTSNPDNP